MGQERIFLIVTGYSGAGRTTVLKNLEDIGYRTVDNLPLNLLPALINETDYLDMQLKHAMAVGIDPNSYNFHSDSLKSVLHKLKKNKQIDLRLVFLVADEHAIVRRYTETRRPHPLDALTLLDSVRMEITEMQPIRDYADHIVDTTMFSSHEVGQVIRHMFKLSNKTTLRIELISFAYKLGIPRHLDILLDARFLNNPFYQESLKELTGCDDKVQSYLRVSSEWEFYFDHLKNVLKASIDGFRKNGRSYVTIGCGCTGGQHRSVFMVEEIAKFLKVMEENVTVKHRDITK